MTSQLDHGAVSLSWVLRMRWGMFAGLVGLTLVVAWLAPATITSWAGVIAVLALEGASNVAFFAAVRRRLSPPMWLSGLVLATDLILLTGLLVLTGGAQNPFAVLYVVHVAVAAVVLPSTAAVGLAVFAGGLYGALYLLDDGGDHAHHLATMELHVKGMWFAYLLSAALIVVFVGRLARALRQRTEQLHRARLSAERAERLAALGTLASGAAHEMNTPLSTIAVVAAELEHNLTAQQADPSLIEDARLLLDEVGRCSEVLSRLSADAGATLGELPRSHPPAVLVERATGLLSPRPGQLQTAVDTDAPVYGPPEGFAQALRALVQNALDATTAPGGRVEVKACEDAGQVVVEVADNGPGLDADVRDRLGEPFVTTKGGMGLGVFLARSLFERFGGTLTFHAATPQGTIVRLRLPKGEAA